MRMVSAKYMPSVISLPLSLMLLMSTYGITMKMETADNSDFEGGFEATLGNSIGA